MRRINNSQARKNRTKISAALREIQADIINPPDRHVALEQIKNAMEDREAYYNWFNEIYKLKSAGLISEYEAAITQKLAEVQEVDVCICANQPTEI